MDNSETYFDFDINTPSWKWMVLLILYAFMTIGFINIFYLLLTSISCVLKYINKAMCLLFSAEMWIGLIPAIILLLIQLDQNNSITSNYAKHFISTILIIEIIFMNVIFILIIFAKYISKISVRLKRLFYFTEYSSLDII